MTAPAIALWFQLAITIKHHGETSPPTSCRNTLQRWGRRIAACQRHRVHAEPLSVGMQPTPALTVSLGYDAVINTTHASAQAASLKFAYRY